jgi:hypothetical protein
MLMGYQTRINAILVCSALWAGRPQSVRRTVPIAQAPTVKAEAVAVAPVAPWDRRQGRTELTPFSGPPSIQWSVDLGAPVTRPLTSFDGTVIAVAGGSLHRVGPGGERLWSAPMSADGVAREFGGAIFVANDLGAMSVVDPATGGLTASYGGSGRVGTAPLEVGGRTVWFNSDGALNQAEGPSPSALDGPISDAASAGEVAILGNMFGEVAAVSLTERIWLSTLPGPVIAHPVVDGNRVYVPFGAKQGQPGGVAALNTETGAVLWSTRIQFEVGAAPALGRFLVVPGKAGGLVALDTEHGGVRWRTPDASPFTVQPIVFGGTVLAGDAQGGLQLVDMDDGGSVWRIDLGSPITGEGTALGETLVFGTADGRLVGVAE